MTDNKLTGLRYGNNAQYLLSELAAYDADDIDGDEFEVYGEDSNGREGSATISITELAADAAKLLAAKDAELQEYRNAPVSLLRCFYVAYDGWLKNGANDGGIFTFEAGLCANAYDYFQNIGVDSTGPLNEMHAAFAAAGLNEKLPFNESPEQYAEEQSRGGCHANSSRVEWVRSQVSAEPQEAE